MVSDEKSISFCSYVNFTLPVILSYFFMLCVVHYIAPYRVGTVINTFGTIGNKRQVEKYTFLITKH